MIVPLPEAKKQAILTNLRESGDPRAIEIADAIENGRIKMYEMNDAVRERYGLDDDDTRGLQLGKNIYVESHESDAVMAATAAHEGAHVFDKTPRRTYADTLRIERTAYNKQVDVWEALKKKDPSLTDPVNDAIVKFRKDGVLDEWIIDEYIMSKYQ